ncbi:MAG: isoprenylcysteine carboxylmethyltransferase family protein [Proteobacteria bacterium]|nr:isoprenylcysteine carboxylmethyltransferase family protein [Pseudomonadota bacterium]
MTHDTAPAYGLWTLVILNSAVFIFFAFSFGKPRTPRGWRSFSAFSAFIVALFAEMYGFPLTVYLLSGWLQRLYPGINLMSHEAGHLWSTVFGLKGNPHVSITHVLSYVFIGGGFILLSSAWNVRYQAQKQHRLVTTGSYAHVRHPQYVAFIAIMFGFLLQWPTILTLTMFLVLVAMYIHLAHTEEAETHRDFGGEYENYAAEVPAWFPYLRRQGLANPLSGR